MILTAMCGAWRDLTKIEFPARLCVSSSWGVSGKRKTPKTFAGGMSEKTGLDLKYNDLNMGIILAFSWSLNPVIYPSEVE